jgi:FkbM family methyltransferase
MSFAVTLYRLYFAPKALVNRMVGRSPRAQRGLNRTKAVVRRYLLPKTREWLQVQTGLSQGMWMRLTLPDEARYWRGEHDLDVQRALEAAVHGGSVVYDIGAHLGFFALGAAQVAGQSGRVVAFDGDPDNAVRLRENALYNHLEGRFEVVHAAVWSSSAGDGIPFRRGIEPRAQGGVESDGHRPILGSADLITVPVITLDEFIARGAPPPDVIKIDVEGGEAEVLRGGARLFATKRPIIIAEVHHDLVAAKIRPWLVEKRYCENWNLPEGTYPRQLFAWPEEFDGADWMHRRIACAAKRKR